MANQIFGFEKLKWERSRASPKPAVRFILPINMYGHIVTIWVRSMKTTAYFLKHKKVLTHILLSTHSRISILRVKQVMFSSDFKETRGREGASERRERWWGGGEGGGGGGGERKRQRGEER